jgi:hypothetical protein
MSAKIVALIIALLLGLWFTFDGSRAFVTGDYTTPRSGPHAGQLGPWSRIVSALGVDPRSGLVKSLHVALGALWLAGLFAFLFKPEIGWWILLPASICSLWYLPIGTALSAVEIVLLLLPHMRNLQ